MKKIFNSFLIVAVMASVASISSCTKTCDAGYEGSDCKTQILTKFLKTGATVSEVCGTVTSTPYVVDVATGSDATHFRIKNLGGYSCTAGDYYVVLTVKDGTNSTIDAQTVCATAWSGTAVYSATAKTLTVNYTAVYTIATVSHTDVCSAVIHVN